MSAAAASPERVRLIGTATLPHAQIFDGTVVGGLSGIDYDAGRDRWIAISDDRSKKSPARAYTLRFDYDADAFRSATVEGVTILRQPDGSVYPNEDQFTKAGGAGVVPDFESVRLDPTDGTWWYTSEGDQKRGLPPFIRHAKPDGTYLGELPLSPMMRWGPTPDSGLRSNLVFEGLTFAADRPDLWYSLEGPLVQDGPIPTPEHGGVSRFTLVATSGEVLGQFAYPIDPIPAPPGEGKEADNGISEILALDADHFLVLERAAVEAEDKSVKVYIRLYEASLAGATNVAKIEALAGASYRPMNKELVVNFEQLPGKVDNLEGIAWGRTLPNGNRTLVVVADDNFSAKQVTQVWVFEVMAVKGTNR